MLSWAVPKGPSYDPADKRMAIHVEDHPSRYGSFEGTIPPSQYGAGTVIVWDRGTWEPVGDPREGMEKGKLVFTLHGQKLAGLWELVRIAKPGDKQDLDAVQEARRVGAAAAPSTTSITALPDSVVAKPLGPGRGSASRAARRRRSPQPRAGADDADLPAPSRRAAAGEARRRSSPRSSTAAPHGGDWISRSSSTATG